MSQREKARDLVELVCGSLGVDPKSCPVGGKEGLVSEVEYWLRDNTPRSRGYYW